MFLSAWEKNPAVSQVRSLNVGKMFLIQQKIFKSRTCVRQAGKQVVYSKLGDASDWSSRHRYDNDAISPAQQHQLTATHLFLPVY